MENVARDEETRPGIVVPGIQPPSPGGREEAAEVDTWAEEMRLAAGLGPAPAPGPAGRVPPVDPWCLME